MTLGKIVDAETSDTHMGKPVVVEHSRCAALDYRSSFPYLPVERGPRHCHARAENDGSHHRTRATKPQSFWIRILREWQELHWMGKPWEERTHRFRDLGMNSLGPVPMLLFGIGAVAWYIKAQRRKSQSCPTTVASSHPEK